MRWPVFLIILMEFTVVFASAPTKAAPCDVPVVLADGWQVAKPGDVGINGAELCAVLDGVNSDKANVHSVIVERHRHLVAELYRSGPDKSMNTLLGLGWPFAPDVSFDASKIHDIRSISKSVIGLLVGIAVGEGKIDSVDLPVQAFYPDELQGAIRLRHLLSMSSGLTWDEGGLPNDETRLFFSFNPARFVLKRPAAHDPGAVFNYNSGGVLVLGEILKDRYQQSLTELVNEKLFKPLDITHWEFATDPFGRELAFTGLRMVPRDMVKLGRLMLDKGQWKGHQVVPADWVAQSMRAHISTGIKNLVSEDGPIQYGYLWWGGKVDWRGQSLNWSAGFGNGGQRIFVVPALDLSVVMTAGAYNSAEISPHELKLFGQIVSAVER